MRAGWAGKLAESGATVRGTVQLPYISEVRPLLQCSSRWCVSRCARLVGIRRSYFQQSALPGTLDALIRIQCVLTPRVCQQRYLLFNMLPMPPGEPR